MKSKWTMEQEQFINDNYQRLGASECGKLLNKSRVTVFKKAKELGLKGPNYIIDGSKKRCPRCKDWKEFKEFSSSSRTKSGLACYCKQCCSEKWFENHKYNLSILQKSQDNHREAVRIRNQQHYKKNRTKTVARQVRYNRHKRNTVPSFKIRLNLSRRINECLHGQGKTESTLKLLGCSLEALKKHLESKFQTGMSWANYGLYGWHIDHIVPCSSFDLTKIPEQRECFHYSNLQPLWAKDNLRKSDRLTP